MFVSYGKDFKEFSKFIFKAHLL